MRKALLAVAAAISIQGAAEAQAPTPPLRLEGTVTAVSDSSITIQTANGPQTTALIPSRVVNLTEPTAVDKIVPGSYVATANKTQVDGSGVSIELRVYPPGPNNLNVNRAMDASGETIMTNGTVATAVSSDGGRLLTVNYGRGTRQIRVPPEVQVIGNTPADPSVVKVGTKLQLVNFTPGPGAPPLQIITIAKKDLPSQ